MAVARTKNSLFALDSTKNNIDIIKETKDNKNTILEAVKIDDTMKKIESAAKYFDLFFLNSKTLIQKANKLNIPR
jgi:hypothetical protein